MSSHLATLTTAATLALALASCGDSGTTSDEPSPIGESPTGTFLDPLAEDGYATLDETCEKTDSPEYLARFETPMFRDVAVIDNIAYLVDGSLLWAVAIGNPTRPVRQSLTRLPGHPLAVSAGPEGSLLVAAGHAGMLVLDVGAGEEPTLQRIVDLPGMALDVDVEDGRAYVPLGDEGLSVIDVTDPLEPQLIDTVRLAGFANAVDATAGGRAHVAACSTFSIVDFSVPGEPIVLGEYWVPEGHAKGIHVVDEDVFVAGGEALFAFDAGDPTAVRWTGYYADPEAEGFYVNAVVVDQGIAYIAAGDESVRAVNVAFLDDSGTYLPPRDGDEPPGLDDAIDMPEPSMESTMIAMGDPINVGLAGDLLLVLGNFRWVGERLLRVMRIPVPGIMEDVGAYTQPDQIRGAHPFGDDLLVHTATGGGRLITVDGEPIADLDLPAPVRDVALREATAHLLLEDGSAWTFDGSETSYSLGPGLTSQALTATRGYYASWMGNSIRAFERIPGEGDAPLGGLHVESALLGFSRLHHHRDRLYAYDWAMARLHVIDWGVPDITHAAYDLGPCEAYDIGDFYDGTSTVPSRLMTVEDQLLQFCPEDGEGRASLRVIDPDGVDGPAVIDSVELPPAAYAEVMVRDGVIYTLSFDNGRYSSALSRLEGSAWLTHSYDGHANRMAFIDKGIVVADGDQGLLKFEETVDGFELAGEIPFEVDEDEVTEEEGGPR